LDALQCELWRDECLRKGRPDIRFESLRFRLGIKREESDGNRCAGLHLQGQTGCGWRFDRDFGNDVFADVATLARQQLIENKVVKLDDSVTYEVHATRRDQETPAPASSPEISLTVEEDEHPIEHLSHPLPQLVSSAKTIGTVDGEMPVIYTEEALAQSERFARRGVERNPPSETGGVQIGPLCSCPETGELYVVVTHVLEVQGAEEAPYSLSYTGESWNRIQNIVQAMRSRPSSRAYQIVGQCHGHNFPPAGGAPPCDACRSQAECHRRSDSASIDDRIWTQANFHRAPWALCHIFGSNARGDNVQSLYTLRNNRLQSRGFYVVPNFQPASQ
jgi:hypothetical protein